MVITQQFTDAYYVKLGKGGCWAEDSIANGRIRVGWPDQKLDDIRAGNWATIQGELCAEITDPVVAKRALRALQTLCHSTPQDVWITFHNSKLWWGRIQPCIFQDGTSKYFGTVGGWSCQDVEGTILLANEVPARLSILQGFRATVCHVKEADLLRRLINARPSEEYARAMGAKGALVAHISEAIRQIHWKDFEVLVDLIFRQAGWRRVSGLGGTTKFTDMDLMEPVTGDLYQVQVKSRAGRSEFEQYAADFEASAFRRLYFVVHSPEDGLDKDSSDPAAAVQLIGPKRLARMVVDAGLVDWVLQRTR